MIILMQSIPVYAERIKKVVEPGDWVFPLHAK
jgi:hypothetical protein